MYYLIHYVLTGDKTGIQKHGGQRISKDGPITRGFLMYFEKEMSKMYNFGPLADLCKCEVLGFQEVAEDVPDGTNN